MKTINVGIIGCGKIAQYRHIPEYCENEHTKIAGFFDLDKKRTRELAEKFDAKAYLSYLELLANQDIEAVSVCTTNNTHAEITIAALNAGKHVLCEKPMAASLEDCQAMVDTSRQQGRILMIGQNQRLQNAQICKKTDSHGAIGEIVSFRTTFGHSDLKTGALTRVQYRFFKKTLRDGRNG